MMITTSEFCRSAASCGVWLTGLQRFADESGLSLAISYMPRGTRKWTCTGQQEVSRTERNTPLQGRVAHEITIEQISAPEQANQVSGARLMPVKRSITAPAWGKECRMGWNHTLTPGRVSAAEAGAR